MVVLIFLVQSSSPPHSSKPSSRVYCLSSTRADNSETLVQTGGWTYGDTLIARRLVSRCQPKKLFPVGTLRHHLAHKVRLLIRNLLRQLGRLGMHRSGIFLVICSSGPSYSIWFANLTPCWLVLFVPCLHLALLKQPAVSRK